MQKNLLIVCFLVIFCLSFINSQGSSKNFVIQQDSAMTFDQFKKNYGKKYANSVEDVERKSNFERNLARLKEAPCDACGVTPYFDHSDEELALLRGLKIDKITNPIAAQKVTQKTLDAGKGVSKNLVGSTSSSTSSISVGAGEALVDWRTSGKVTPVRDQANCGSCWAFATVAFFESHLLVSGRVSTAATLNLAEQLVLKCDTKSGGCKGGNCGSASNLVISKGLPLESKFPYNPTKSYSKICSANAAYKFAGLTMNYYGSYTKKSDVDISAWLSVRPIVVYVTASTWYMYKPATPGQIFQCLNSDSISTSTINHAVLLVGQTADAWIIKNSWGTGYGESGYIYVTKNRDFNCGIGFFLYTLV